MSPGMTKMMGMQRLIRHCEKRSDEATQKDASKDWVASLRSQ
jgi:hypothetical protein